MPWLWKVGMTVLVACLLASMAIAIVRLATTPVETIGAGFHDLRPEQVRAYHRASRSATP